MEQIKLVKGNDVTFRIEVTQKDEGVSSPVDFTGVADLHVFVVNGFPKEMKFTISGNVISFVFKGAYQNVAPISIEAYWGGKSHRFYYGNVATIVNATDDASLVKKDDIEISTVEMDAEVFIGGPGGVSGRSPYIGYNGNWFEFCDTTGEWRDTGIKAAGAKGDKGVHGEQGIQGIPGQKGDAGVRGEKGEPGENGTDAPLPQIQYSADALSWHITKTDEDLYWRISVDGGVTWSDAIFFKDTVQVSVETAVVKTINPGTLYLWGEVASLDITLSPPANSNILNEYMFQFTSGATATTLTLPASVVFGAEVSINANKTYQVSIVNNLGVIGEF